MRHYGTDAADLDHPGRSWSGPVEGVYVGGAVWGTRRRLLALVVAVGAVVASVGPIDGVAAAPREASEHWPADVGVVADSLGVRAEDQLRAVFRNRRPVNVLALTDGAYVDWVRRRWVDTILRDPPSILVVILGHGDGTHSTSPTEFRGEVRAFLAEVVPRVDCVRWFDVRERWTYYRNVNRRAAAYNRVLRQEAARWGRVEVVDWSAWADRADDRYFEEDRLHPSPAGRWVLARMARDAADGCDRALRTGPYWDVLDQEAHAPAVRWLHRRGIVRDDHGNGTFRDRLGHLTPPLTRQDLALWLWRRAGRPNGAPLPSWTDVPPLLWAPVAWLADQGLLAGMADGTFRPDRPVSRGELLRSLWLLAGAPTGHPPAPWPDVPPRLTAAAAWAWSTEALPLGPDAGLRPTRPVSRALAARALAPTGLPDPSPPPAPSGPFPPPRRLYGDPPHGNFFARAEAEARAAALQG